MYILHILLGKVSLLYSFNENKKNRIFYCDLDKYLMKN